ncbi:MAG TPA: DUF5615 family PIN-like protein [Aggregatilineaceae bacterium]|jgi:hypothetical protein|nr:DUF5615 family PIN-like protein [Aggregatilineaceae bacterium]
MRFVADENFNGRILERLHQEFEDLDVVRIQDTGLYGAPDPAVLEWAAQEGRIILTHDVQTLVSDAYERIKQELPVPGVILVPNTLAIGLALNDLKIAIGAGQPEDFEDRVIFIPLE